MTIPWLQTLIVVPTRRDGEAVVKAVQQRGWLVRSVVTGPSKEAWTVQADSLTNGIVVSGWDYAQAVASAKFWIEKSATVVVGTYGIATDPGTATPSLVTDTAGVDTVTQPFVSTTARTSLLEAGYCAITRESRAWTAVAPTRVTLVAANLPYANAFPTPWHTALTNHPSLADARQLLIGAIEQRFRQQPQQEK